MLDNRAGSTRLSVAAGISPAGDPVSRNRDVHVVYSQADKG
jgi:hypothetical protein